jgi:hypothetical protein
MQRLSLTLDSIADAQSTIIANDQPNARLHTRGTLHVTDKIP